MNPTLVISGGQTGADQGALYAAQACGIPTGGTAPKRYMTENGPAPWLEAAFGLVEQDTMDVDYPSRTRANVHAAHATLIFTHTDPITEGGTALTYRVAHKAARGGKGPGLFVCLLRGADPAPGVEEIRAWLDECITAVKDRGRFVLNVAGPRESRCRGLSKAVHDVLVSVFSTPRKTLGGTK